MIASPNGFKVDRNRRYETTNNIRIYTCMENSWEAVKEQTIIKSFEERETSNSIDDNKDDAVFERSDKNSSDETNINEMSDITKSEDEQVMLIVNTILIRK